MKKAFTLLEIIIFIAITSLFFIGALSATTGFLKASKSAEYRLFATRYAEEIIEWLRGEKEGDWLEFITSKTSLSPGTPWCFNLGTTWPAESGACSAYDFNNTFKRNVVLTNLDTTNTRVSAQITVSWLEGTTERNVQLNTLFAIQE